MNCMCVCLKAGGTGGKQWRVAVECVLVVEQPGCEVRDAGDWWLSSGTEALGERAGGTWFEQQQGCSACFGAGMSAVSHGSLPAGFPWVSGDTRLLLRAAPVLSRSSAVVVHTAL